MSIRIFVPEDGLRYWCKSTNTHAGGAATGVSHARLFRKVGAALLQQQQGGGGASTSANFAGPMVVASIMHAAATLDLDVSHVQLRVWLRREVLALQPRQLTAQVLSLLAVLVHKGTDIDTFGASGRWQLCVGSGCPRLAAGAPLAACGGV